VADDACYGKSFLQVKAVKQLLLEHRTRVLNCRRVTGILGYGSSFPSMCQIAIPTRADSVYF